MSERTPLSLEERTVLESLDSVLHLEEIRAQLNPIVQRVGQRLAQERTAVMAWEPVPLALFRDRLPASIHSSWVFILRAGATTGAERHPNSHQRMMSFQGSGDLQTGGEGHWESNPLISDLGAGLERRWASIPTNVWHQAVVPSVDWVVVSFHTVTAEELIEERQDAVDETVTFQRRYITS